MSHCASVLCSARACSDKKAIFDVGVSCGSSTYDRASKLWVTELNSGATNMTVRKPSPGIKLFVRDPVGEPSVAAVPSIWYEKLEGTSHGNVFGSIKRTIANMDSEGYFREDPQQLAWWTSWMVAHEPRDDGTSSASDAANSIPRAWPRAAPPRRAVRQPLGAAEVRDHGDQIEFGDLHGARAARGRAAVDEATASGAVEASVQQLIVAKFRYDTDPPRTYRMALGQVVAIENSGTVRNYKVHWLCRSGQAPRDLFSITGKYRKSRASDYGSDAEDESIFDVAPSNIVCALAKTRARGVDQPIVALNPSGTIPNPKLASGVNLHAFLAKAVEEQSGRGREPTGDLEFEAVDEAPA